MLLVCFEWDVVRKRWSMRGSEKNPSADLGERIAEAFRHRYARLKEEGRSPDEIFANLQEIGRPRQRTKSNCLTKGASLRCFRSSRSSPMSSGKASLELSGSGCRVMAMTRDRFGRLFGLCFPSLPGAKKAEDFNFRCSIRRCNRYGIDRSSSRT